MAKFYRIILQTYDDRHPDTVEAEHQLLSDSLDVPTNCLNFGMGYEKQISLIQKVQDCVLEKKLTLRQEAHCDCPKCNKGLIKLGNHKSTFHDVLTDHKLLIQRMRCPDCGYEPASTVRTITGTNQSGELKKMQANLGAKFTFRESQDVLELFSVGPRAINNHNRIKQVTESVGEIIGEISKTEQSIAAKDKADELILCVDGGHIATREDGKRSIEAITSVVYRPESLSSNPKETRNYLTSKNCAASVKDDAQEQIISGTMIAALKQGLDKETHITALCDGAANCWSVAESLRPLCHNMTCILDWFHLAMKIENISLPKPLKDRLNRVKWHLWRGRVDRALVRLEQLLSLAQSKTAITRIKRLISYIANNKDRIVNYRERHRKGIVFTSSLAESTVESLINRRCKGQQHMRWSRDGLNPILQLRAAINSKDDWEYKWRTAVLSAS